MTGAWTREMKVRKYYCLCHITYFDLSTNPSLLQLIIKKKKLYKLPNNVGRYITTLYYYYEKYV